MLLTCWRCINTRSQVSEYCISDCCNHLCAAAEVHQAPVFTNYVVMIDIVPADSFKYKWEKERLQKPLSSMVHVHAVSPTATVYLSYRHSLTIWMGEVCVFGDICRAVWSYYWAQFQLTLTAFTYVHYINMHHIYKYNYTVWCFFSAHLTDMQLINDKGHSLTTLTRGTFSHISYFNQLNYEMDVKGS